MPGDVQVATAVTYSWQTDRRGSVVAMRFYGRWPEAGICMCRILGLLLERQPRLFRRLLDACITIQSQWRGFKVCVP